MEQNPNEDASARLLAVVKQLDALSREHVAVSLAVCRQYARRERRQKSGLARVLQPLVRWLYLQLRQAACDGTPIKKR